MNRSRSFKRQEISKIVDDSATLAKALITPAQVVVATSNDPVKNETQGNESKFVLNKFQRSETRDGKKIWEVDAKRGQYFPESNSAKLEDALLYFYKDDGSSLELTAQEAKLNFSGTSLISAEGYKGVTLVNSEVKMQTEQATYDHDKQRIFAPGFVTIKGDLIDVSGYKLEMNMQSKEIKLNENVESLIRPKKSKAER